MIFPQRDTFSFTSETKDKYGTVTKGTATSCLGYIEPEITFASDGSLVSRGKIYTTDTTSFTLDSSIEISGVIYYINNIESHNIPNYNYKIISYV